MSQLNITIGQLISELHPYQIQCTVDNAGVQFQNLINLL